MHKSLFLFSLEPEIVDQAIELAPDSVFIGHNNLAHEQITRLKGKNIKVNVEVGVFAGEDIWEEYPDSHPVLRDGTPLEKIGWYAGINPTHEAVREKKLKEIRNTIDNFDIDGVWLDFIRFPTHWEVPEPKLLETDYSDETLSKFRKDTGKEKPEGRVWTEWKCQQITSFVGDVRTLVDERENSIELGLFAVPWQENEYDGAITKIIGQDFKTLSKLVDVFSPMTYHAMCGRKVEWIQEVISYFHEITGKPVLPLVQTEEKPRTMSAEEFQESLNVATQPPSAGVIIFFFDDLLHQRGKLTLVRKFIN